MGISAQTNPYGRKPAFLFHWNNGVHHFYRLTVRFLTGPATDQTAEAYHLFKRMGPEYKELREICLREVAVP